jgi:hypothetical protein
MNKLRAIIGAVLLAVVIPTTYIAPVVIVAGCSSGCANLHGDPVLIRGEQTLAIGKSVTDAFVQYEDVHNSKGELGQAVRTAADAVRRDAPGWINTVQALVDTYRANRTPDNKAGLLTALAVLQTGIDETNKHLAEAQAQQKKVK